MRSDKRKKITKITKIHTPLGGGGGRCIPKIREVNVGS